MDRKLKRRIFGKSTYLFLLLLFLLLILLVFFFFLLLLLLFGRLRAPRLDLLDNFFLPSSEPLGPQIGLRLVSLDLLFRLGGLGGLLKKTNAHQSTGAIDRGREGRRSHLLLSFGRLNGLRRGSGCFLYGRSGRRGSGLGLLVKLGEKIRWVDKATHGGLRGLLSYRRQSQET